MISCWIKIFYKQPLSGSPLADRPSRVNLDICRCRFSNRQRKACSIDGRVVYVIYV
jgi:hypothetical protein